MLTMFKVEFLFIMFWDVYSDTFACVSMTIFTNVSHSCSEFHKAA